MPGSGAVPHVDDELVVAREVADALSAGHPVVALESTLISHGLPRPDNLRVAQEVETDVRAEGAVPATVAVLDGQVRVGLDEQQLEQVARRDDLVKASVRDLPVLAARGGYGATTVAATAHVADLVGIPLFATGGLGGVHRQARDTWDESADLSTLARVGVTVVCAGVKSILDVPATLERMETLGIAVLGYRTAAFPGFYLTDSGEPVEWRVDSPAEVAAVVRARAALGLDRRALVVANPLPPEQQLDPTVHDRLLRAGLAAATEAGVAGKAVTPFLLDFFHRESSGDSLAVNIRIVRRNARLAAQIAAALTRP
ncbi:MAG: pseudouridine-5'-phosphate glycosidase [Acidothermales bacterium]|nr:pseudouridine-5'-phosphate glycosidase [Acidothermales bacterium]